jgi:hypothetical protein
VEIAAVSEDQVNTNTWSPLKDMLGNDKAYDEYPGLEVMQGFINLPYGKIQKRTAEATSAKGAPAHFVVCDQTESWVVTNLGQKLYKTLKNNVIKRGGTMLELPNAFTPGDGSVAETTMAAYRAILAGQTRLGSGVYFDHREAPPETDLTDRESLVAGLAYAYGDSADVPFCSIHNPPCPNPGWVDLEQIADSIWEPDTDVQLAKSDWLNQITHASDSFLSQPAWKGALADPMRILGDRDMIVLGFDGSRGKAKGKPDATALVGCRVSDGHLFEIGVWEAGDIPSHGAGPALDGRLLEVLGAAHRRDRGGDRPVLPRLRRRRVLRRPRKGLAVARERVGGEVRAACAVLGEPQPSVRVVDDRWPGRAGGTGHRAVRECCEEPRPDPRRLLRADPSRPERPSSLLPWQTGARQGERLLAEEDRRGGGRCPGVPGAAGCSGPGGEAGQRLLRAAASVLRGARCRRTP